MDLFNDLVVPILKAAHEYPHLIMMLKLQPLSPQPSITTSLHLGTIPNTALLRGGESYS
ncbi:MAG TPA: hypothetical protein VHF08_06685 [Nitrososphaeraceae archaeon]|nr:hypothetical protein [Nitrososphaeraceae archaeon]